jgi:hypothetical protein
MSTKATYVYCLIAAPREPSIRSAGKGLPGTGRVRLLAVPGGSSVPRARGVRRSPRLARWLAVADAPVDRYGESAINHRLTDLDWVSRAAVAHESVVESFIDAGAVLPMKLFTIFASDERALEHIRTEGRKIDAVVNRVLDHHEWGVRVLLDRSTATAGAAAGRRTTDSSGAGYLARKKAQRDRTAELGRKAREVVADLYDRLATHSSFAKRRSATELPVKGGPLLLDAAFLVPRSRTTRFRAAVAREARALAPDGYGLTLSGPWPPYSFMHD